MPPYVRESPFTTPRSSLNELCPLLCFGISGKKQNEKRHRFKQRKRSKGVFLWKRTGGWGMGAKGKHTGMVTGWGSLIYLAVRDRNSIKNHLV